MATQRSSSVLAFYVNGRLVKDDNVDPTFTLLEYLRKKLRLCGTKLGCSEGGCGACTVMVSKYNRDEQRIEHFSVNACLAPVCSMHGLAVTTVEGIGSTKDRLHPVQERIYKSHGSQCGFCTPGIVMSMYTLLRNNHHPSLHELEIYFQGNLCRCTGYRPILESYKSFTTIKCCRNNDNCENNSNNNNCDIVNGCCRMNGSAEYEKKDCHLINPSGFLPYDESQEPIFPSQLQISDEFDKEFLEIERNGITWYRPTDLDSLLEMKNKFSNAKLTIGNTEIGIEMKFKNCNYPILISPTAIPELNAISWHEDGITVGAAVTLSRLNDCLIDATNKLPEFKTRIFAAIIEMLRWFAGKQIRNVASLGGNIMTASPISDLNPLFVAAGSYLQLISKNGNRTVKMDDKFFLSYRKTLIKQDEILLSVTIPYSSPNEFFFGFKQAQRKEDDIAIVNAGMRVLFQNDSDIVNELSLAFGGMAPTTVIARKTMKFCIQKHWNQELVESVLDILTEDLPLEPSAPGGMVQYRRTLATSFFFMFFHKVLNQMKGNHGKMLDQSVITELERKSVQSTQVFQEISPGQSLVDPVGRPLPHVSSALQATGEAAYVDDIPCIQGELFMALVTSARACARISSIDAQSALALERVRGFYCSRDLPPERNHFGSIEQDEQVFASGNVTCQGQIVGAIVADDEQTARAAAALVKIEYEEYDDPIITIEDAIDRDSFFHHLTQTLKKGDPERALQESDHVIEGELRIGGQEHFCMEPQGCLVIPKENGEMEVISSTQNPFETQMMVAEVIGVPSNRIVCKVKRIGGGFGGKESRSIAVATATAVGAKMLNRPVRCILRRDEDMVLTGTRHPFLFRYKVGFSEKGVLRALSVEMFANAGNTVDLSPGVAIRALMHVDNVYRIPHVYATCYLCKTNLPSCTAFRGFGGPQGMFLTESFMEEISKFLGEDASKIRELNMYREGDVTHFNQLLDPPCTIGKCWAQCQRRSDFLQRQEKIRQFNRESRWKKRGIAMIPVKFGIAFNVKFLNQAGALVHIYKDGAVLITHGGVEMGQGLHTKMIQVACRVLGVPVEKVYLSETSTDKVPNASATAASVGSDIYGMAILRACQTLMSRLEPFVKKNPEGSWEEWVRDAYLERVSLSATGFYKIPDLNYDLETNSGRAYNYFCFGAGCSEVEIDCLTGDHQVLRTDIVMDVGESLNPAIDIGQIEGAFIQGYGLFTMEEPKYSPQGYLYTRGPGTYKIPGFGDIPTEFNVTLLKNTKNPRAVYSSKAIGEPPLFLASSVFFAIKNAIAAAREDSGVKGHFRLDSPATAATIRISIGDKISQMFKKDATPSDNPWSVTV